MSKWKDRLANGRRWYETPDCKMSIFFPFQEYRVKDSE